MVYSVPFTLGLCGDRDILRSVYLSQCSICGTTILQATKIKMYRTLNQVRPRMFASRCLRQKQDVPSVPWIFRIIPATFKPCSRTWLETTYSVLKCSAASKALC